MVEDFFLDKKCGEAKKKCVVDACKVYFNNDDELVEKIIDLVFRDVVKSTFLRRNQTRILNFFCMGR